MKVCGMLNTRRIIETHKSNIIDNMLGKRILLASKAKHLSTSQVKIYG